MVIFHCSADCRRLTGARLPPDLPEDGLVCFKERLDLRRSIELPSCVVRSALRQSGYTRHRVFGRIIVKLTHGPSILL